MPIIEEQENEAERMFRALRDEQDEWLRRYTPIISEQWFRLKGRRLYYTMDELNLLVQEEQEEDDGKDDEKDDEHSSDDEVVTDDLNQKMMNIAPAPQSPVERSEIQEEEEKAEETHEPPHLPHSQMPE